MHAAKENIAVWFGTTQQVSYLLLDHSHSVHIFPPQFFSLLFFYFTDVVPDIGDSHNGSVICQRCINIIISYILWLPLSLNFDIFMLWFHFIYKLYFSLLYLLEFNFFFFLFLRPMAKKIVNFTFMISLDHFLLSPLWVAFSL